MPMSECKAKAELLGVMAALTVNEHGPRGEAPIHSPVRCNVDRTYSSSLVSHKMKGFYWILILLLLSVGQIESVQAAPASSSGAAPAFPMPVEDYHDEQITGITAKLVQRIQAEPFNLVGTLIFIGAIIHTFLASKFMLIAHRLEHQYLALKEQEKDASDDKELSRMRDRLQFRAQLFHLVGSWLPGLRARSVISFSMRRFACSWSFIRAIVSNNGQKRFK